MRSKNPTPLSKRALGIVRVSTREQSRGNSPGVQRDGIVAYARDLGLQLVDVVEIHESGKDSAARPLFNAALERARRESSPHIIFWVWDRVGRNFTDLERLEREINAGQLVMHSAFERREFNSESTSSDWLSLEVQGLTAKQYSRDLRRRAIESMAAKAAGGWYPVRAPFGYRNEKARGAEGQVLDRGGTIELEPWGAAITLRMIELRLSGHSFEAIADMIAVDGCGAPQRRLSGFRGAGRQKRVEQILKNPFYVGEFEWRGQLYQGKHEPVLTRAQWNALQATFNGKHAPDRAGHKEAALAGFLVCGECGCRVTYDPKTKKSGRTYDYYRCANGRRVHGKLIYTAEAAVLRGFEPMLDAITIEPALADGIAAELNATHSTIQRARRGEARRFGKTLEELQEREDSLFDMLRRGTLDDEGYKRQLARVRAERTVCTEQLAGANEHLDDSYLRTAQRVLELAQNVKTLWKTRSPSEKRKLLEIVVSNPTLTNGTVGFDLKKVFSVLAEMRECDRWHARRDSNPRRSVPKTDALSS
jgi:site-specific DNA recombinase